jgi:hypothetical protein
MAIAGMLKEGWDELDRKVDSHLQVHKLLAGSGGADCVVGEEHFGHRRLVVPLRTARLLF